MLTHKAWEPGAAQRKQEIMTEGPKFPKAWGSQGARDQCGYPKYLSHSASLDNESQYIRHTEWGSIFYLAWLPIPYHMHDLRGLSMLSPLNPLFKI